MSKELICCGVIHVTDIPLYLTDNAMGIYLEN